MRKKATANRITGSILTVVILFAMLGPAIPFGLTLDVSASSPPVLLVHGHQFTGRFSPVGMWAEMAEYLTGVDPLQQPEGEQEWVPVPSKGYDLRKLQGDNGLAVYISSYTQDTSVGTSRDIRWYARSLASEIKVVKENAHSDRVDVVAHSMGGLVARAYIENEDFGGDRYPGDVGKLIMLGTPNHGVPYGWLRLLLPEAEAALQAWESVRDMLSLPDSIFLSSLNDGVTGSTMGVDYTTIAGVDSNFLSDALHLWFPNDGVVGTESVWLGGAERNYAWDVDHSGLLTNNVILAFVARALRSQPDSGEPPPQTPDLTVTQVTAPTSASIGSTVNVTFTTANLRDGPSGSFENLVSLGTSPWGTQTHLGYFGMDSLASVSQGSDAVQVTIPTTVLPGRYWVTVYADALDNVAESNEGNNIEKASAQIQILATSETDITSPEVVLVGPADGEVWATGGQRTISWSASDDVGVESVDLYFTTDGWENSEKLLTTTAAVSDYDWTVPTVDTTEAQFMVIAWDAAGHGGIDVSHTFAITSEPDLLPAPTLHDPQVSGSNYTISWTSVEEAKHYVLQEGDGSQFLDPTEYLLQQTSKYFGGRSLDTYYYRVAAVNEYGAGVWSETKSVTLSADQGPGGIDLLHPQDEAVGQPLTVTLQWNASHPGGEALSYDVYLMPVRSDSLNSAHIVSTRQTGTTYIATDLEFNRTYTWGVRAWDETNQNRLSPIYHFTTIADNSPPTGSITINDDDETTDSYGVTLHLSASDTESTVHYMRFSNDGQNWTSWRWFGSHYPWNIADYKYGGKPNQSVYTVYAQFKDAQGNESITYSDTITKAEAAPGNIILNGNYYETVRDAVAAAQSGDTVYLTEGTYAIWGQTNPPRYPSTAVGIVLKPGVTLKGAGADVTKIVLEGGLWTVIDADGSSIQGLTVVMADASGVRQAVLMESDSSEIRNCVIQSTYDGIGITGNSNLVANNVIRESQTGISSRGGTNVRIYNNTIAYNTVAGIVSDEPNVEIKNNVIAFGTQWGVYVRSATDFRNNDVHGNWKDYDTTPDWLQDQTGVNGNISADPQLTSDYHLSAGSPAIDAGTDVGIPFSGSAPDMGAFEYNATGTLRVVSNHEDASFTIFGLQSYNGEGKDWSVSGLPIGTYSIVFSPISLLYTPQYDIRTLMSNQTIVFDGTYHPDDVPPSGSISVNSDEYATADQIVAITLSINDDVAGLEDGAEMTFSNDGVAWSPPEVFSTLRKGWDLTNYGGNPDPGTKTVYAKVSDDLGNWMTEPVTDTILYVADRKTLHEVPTEYSTIQSAIDAAQNGDVVHVLPGEYKEGDIVLKEGVRLQGSGPGITSLNLSTITAESNTVIDGFTINKEPFMGYQGILVRDASPIISNNVIRAIRGIEIQGNSEPIIRNNLFADCELAVFITPGIPTVMIVNNTISGSFRAIYIQNVQEGTRIQLQNNIIANTEEAGIFDNSFGDEAHQHVFSSFNLFWNNAGGDYEGVQKDKMSVEGDMHADPLFTDPSNGDFSLQDGSPAVDSGHPDAQFNDTNGTRNDRGAYGGQYVNTPPLADFILNVELGSPGTLFLFDASTSHDFEGEDENLFFRWDFGGDGTYDTDFQTTKQIDHQYTTPAEYNVILQVRDSGFFLSTISRTVEVVNQSPITPGNPSPASNSKDQPVELTLSWDGGHLDPGVDVTYDVYFGRSTAPPLVSPDQTETTYGLGTLEHHEFYFWKIVATDGNGLSVSSPVWSFLTEQQPVPEPPTSLVTTATSATQIDLKWHDNSDNELGFKIERKLETDEAYTLIDIIPADGTSSSDFNLTEGTLYYYRVCAYDGTGSSAFEEAHATTFVTEITPVCVDLVDGWNIIALAVNPTTPYTASTLAADINAQGGGITQVFWWNATAGTWVYYLVSSGYGPDFDIEAGYGYLLKNTTSTTWCYEGTPLSADYVGTVQPRVTNVGEKSFTIAWHTDSAETGHVIWGTEPGTLDQTRQDNRNYNPAGDPVGDPIVDDTHHVTISGLTAVTTYYYRVVSGGITYDDGGDPYEIITGPNIDFGMPVIIGGKVYTDDAKTIPAEGAIVYARIGDSQWLSSLVDAAGNWGLNIKALRTGDYLNAYSFTDSSVLSLEANGSADGSASSDPTVGTAKANEGTGAPDMVVSLTVEMDLSDGWNLIALPIPTATDYTASTLAADINSQGGGVTQVFWWNAAGGTWVYYLVSSGYGPDFDIELGEGYLLKNTTACTWVIQGN